ncbi:uncharacterized protein LOC111397025 [Olea europaea var. sylvestris]|uniref:Uncharacterized protein n=1 Tax=Olea europaea subsp. europaea TaxID=158383 RepID=A0A8S0R813_OLEEU|nr:uncharacterized protein LOC111397024 [Olea europaea var. sylvestris]XP_022879454.1 uncharacterized protein LOC111397024 [Olea europaea var. sylvestris]XP_022879455.1 uncharacterized protein LOC111397025 [Olea europaea var. sylvestris]CAA2974987.1 Hypothetical predicted protein [Olea europaea subsp. europaea]
MEKFLNPYDKEYMKMTMLKHEETFREQIRELHRLYHKQKILMTGVAKNRQNMHDFESISEQMNGHGDVHKKARQYLDLGQPAENFEEEDESELELTLGPKSYYRKRKDTETPLASDSGPSFSSSSSRIKFTTRQELLNPSFFSIKKNSSEVEEKLRQDILNHHPRLMQVLSSNMT